MCIAQCAEGHVVCGQAVCRQDVFSVLEKKLRHFASVTSESAARIERTHASSTASTRLRAPVLKGMSEARGGAAAAPLVLEDVVACIMGQANAKPAITARIQRHGGRAATRLGKEVSHIVWERRHSRRPSDKAADEAELLELFHKLEKVRLLVLASL